MIHAVVVWALAIALQTTPVVERRVEVDLAPVERPERMPEPPPVPARPPSAPRVEEMPRPVEPRLDRRDPVAEVRTPFPEPTHGPRLPSPAALPRALPPPPPGQFPEVPQVAEKASPARSPAPPDVASLPDVPPAVSRPLAEPARPAASEAVDDYFAAIRAKIEREKRYPRWAKRAGIEGRVTLAFRLTAGGELAEARVADSSGSRHLDEAALEALQRGAPYPEFPGDPSTLPGEIEVLVVFDLR